jgi:hypothetical protein
MVLTDFGPVLCENAQPLSANVTPALVAADFTHFLQTVFESLACASPWFQAACVREHGLTKLKQSLPFRMAAAISIRHNDCESCLTKGVSVTNLVHQARW